MQGWSALFGGGRALDAGDGRGRGGTASGTATGVSSADLFASYHPQIRRYVLSLVHDPVEADDLTQDVFVQAHRKLVTVRDPDALVSWLYRIATHLCYDFFRRSSRQPRTEPLIEDGWGGGGSLGDVADQLDLGQALEQADMSACVRSYIEELSTQYQQVILLHDVEEVTNPEIAGMLGVSLDAVKIRLHRARRKLQAALSVHCDMSLDEHGVLVCEPRAETPAGKSNPSARETQTQGVSHAPIGSS